MEKFPGRAATALSWSTEDQPVSTLDLSSSPKVPFPTRFLGRQPILDANLKLYGYELLYRAGPVQAFSGDPEKATRQVIDNYLLLMPEIDQGTGFVNCTRETLVTGLVTLLPPENTVLEILETIKPDMEVLASCKFLKGRGYRFALDDFAPDDGKEAFLQFADFIKIDFRASDATERQAIYRMTWPRGAIMLAEKIETAAEMKMAIEEGCELFQGYFFSKPIIVAHPVIPPNYLICLRLMAALSEARTDIGDIASLVMLDASLCYRLLRLVNSVLFGLNSRVTSIRNALVIAGSDEFRKLVVIALAGSFAAAHSKTLVALAIERAKFCEMLSPQLKEPGPKLYLLGMLSLIDAILQIPMAQILESLPLDADMKAALTGHPSAIGVALELIRSYQAGDWDACELLQQKLGLSERVTSRIYMEAVHWADKLIRQ